MRDRRPSAGFTLIEILVVVTVIGIIVSIALLSLSVLGDDRQLRIEARRISSLLAAAQDEAVMQGREFGLELMHSSYRFVEFDPFQARWLELEIDDIFRSRRLPEDLEFELLLEGKTVLLSAEAANIADPDSTNVRNTSEKYAPHVLIFSSGEATPFELRIARRSEQQFVILEGNVMGVVSIMTAEEQADAMR
ncbi:MAG: type II secretion system minor pseudopilin GspH [Gammaproteobacteria bacterium]|nr:type II secretion system minor pseudopilin GspH [Gammaproteobacteria bacterium]MDH5303078.1 type II secretion system minor pseudopilin GspH [Gammaproteobacteria bacterium]MDH5322884.1 type II secretion system minor pseudopilin GspH [Gammaproteobacteria bacterium]